MKIVALCFFVIVCFNIQTLPAKSVSIAEEVIYSNCYKKRRVKNKSKEFPYTNPYIDQVLTEDRFKINYSQNNSDSISISYGEYKNKNTNTEEIKNVIIYFHGTGQTWESVNKIGINPLPENAVIASLSYPCFGQSEGVPSQDLITSLAVSFVHLMGNKYKGANIYFWGFDLGSAVALEVFHQLKYTESSFKPKALVLYSPWTNTQDVCSGLTRIKRICRIEKLENNLYDSLAIAPDIDVPTRVVYTSSDGLVPANTTETFMETLSEGVLQSFRSLRGLKHRELLSEPQVANESLGFLLDR